MPVVHQRKSKISGEMNARLHNTRRCLSASQLLENSVFLRTIGLDMSWLPGQWLYSNPEERYCRNHDEGCKTTCSPCGCYPPKVHSCRPCTVFQDVAKWPESSSKYRSLPSVGSMEQAGRTIPVDDIPCSPKVQFFQRLTDTKISGRIGECYIVGPESV